MTSNNLIQSSLIPSLSDDKLNTSFYWQPTQTTLLSKGMLDVSFYLQSKQATNDTGLLLSAPSSKKAEVAKNALEKYRSTAWNGKQIAVVIIGSTLVAGTLALSICINPLFILAAPVIILTTWYAVKKLSNIDYKIVNIEEDITKISRQDLMFITDLMLDDEKLPDLEFVRYILAGGDFEKLLQHVDGLINAHKGNDDYLANLLRNLQIAKLAKMETCCRRHASDPVNYTDQQKKADIEAIENFFSAFKENLMCNTR